MSAPWLESKTPVAPPTSANPTVRQLVYAGVVTGAWSGIACLVLYGLGRLAGADFALAGASSQTPSAVPWFVFLLLPLILGVAFALAASLLRGRRHAKALVKWIGTLLAIISVIPIFNQPAAGWGTQLLLVLMHAVTWFLVVPQVARIVGDSEPGLHEERDA